MLPRTTLQHGPVLLRPVQSGDGHLLTHLITPGLWDFFPDDLSTPELLNRWVESRVQLMGEGKWLPHVVFYQDLPVGISCYLNIDEPNRVVEIGGTWYGAAYHGTMVNPICKLLLLTHAFETLSFERVEFKTDVLNVHSRRAIAKLGAKEEGTLRSNRIVKNGRRRDTVYYSILPDEWPAVKQQLIERITSYQ